MCNRIDHSFADLIGLLQSSDLDVQPLNICVLTLQLEFGAPDHLLENLDLGALLPQLLIDPIILILILLSRLLHSRIQLSDLLLHFFYLLLSCSYLTILLLNFGLNPVDLVVDDGQLRLKLCLFLDRLLYLAFKFAILLLLGAKHLHQRRLELLQLILML